MVVVIVVLLFATPYPKKASKQSAKEYIAQARSFVFCESVCAPVSIDLERHKPKTKKREKTVIWPSNQDNTKQQTSQFLINQLHAQLHTHTHPRRTGNNTAYPFTHNTQLILSLCANAERRPFEIGEKERKSKERKRKRKKNANESVFSRPTSSNSTKENKK